MAATVLFVDDDALLIDGLRRTVHREPYRALWATSGEEALEVIARESVDLLVADQLMPGIGGVDLLAEVRASQPQVIAILLTGQATAGSVVRALNDGNVFRLLLKPCSREELASSVRLALAYKALQDQQRLVVPLLRRLNTVLERANERYPGIAEDHQQATTAMPADSRSLDSLVAAAAGLDHEILRAMRSLTGRFDL
ncbi:MAG: response regulator [Planctomycetes bacterium]|nr:response regulator [Planctomycetota bacterium]